MGTNERGLATIFRSVYHHLFDDQTGKLYQGDRRTLNEGDTLSQILANLIETAVGPSFEFGGYRVTRSTTHLDELEIFQFRFKVFLESGFISKNDYQGELLNDEFDNAAVQIGVRDQNGVLVGTTRFVLPSNVGFHTERLFDFDLPPINRMQLGEFGRLAVRSTHRGGERLVMLALLKAVFECMIENRTTHVLAFLPPKLADAFAELGCKSSMLRTREPGENAIRNRRKMKGYFESQNPVPVLYDLEQMISEVGVRRAAIAERLQPALTEVSRTSASQPIA